MGAFETSRIITRRAHYLVGFPVMTESLYMASNNVSWSPGILADWYSLTFRFIELSLRSRIITQVKI